MPQKKKEQQFIEPKTETHDASLESVVSYSSSTANTPKKKNKRFIAWQYAKELWSDHRFWKQMTVAKGGLAIVTASILLVPTIMSMPFLLAASAVALSGVLVAAAVFSIGYGTVGLINTFKNTKSKISQKFNNESNVTGVSKSVVKKPDENISLSETRKAFQKILLKKWPFKQIAASRPAKAIANSGPWKKLSSFMNDSDNLLDALTVKSSVASIAIFGGILLTTQAIMIPFFIPIAIAAYSIASLGLGGYMLYKGGKGIISSLKERRQTRKLAQKQKNTTAMPKQSPNKNKKAGKLRFKFWKAKENKPKDIPLQKPANENKITIPSVKKQKTTKKP